MENKDFIKILCWHLPQFHLFSENEEIWGKNFNEWTLVKKRPIFFDQHIDLQPHPDIGYYNLEDFETRKKQAILAKENNVYGFCYYHYWFKRPVMNKVLDKILIDNEPNIKFCFSWANESWKKSMNRGDNSICLKQDYGDIKNWNNHLNYLLPFFKHHNYIKIDNKPLFLIYRIFDIPKYKIQLDYYRYFCKKNGFNGLFVVNTLGNFFEEDPMLEVSKYADANVEFYPNFFSKNKLKFKRTTEANYYDADEIYNYINKFPKFSKIQFLSTLTGFDSSSRNKNNCNIIVGSNPKKFKNSLQKQIYRSKHEFVFINAWNEWSESAVLEPSTRFEYAYLNAIKNVTSKIYL
jgi:hypothetical protein